MSSLTDWTDVDGQTPRLEPRMHMHAPNISTAAGKQEVCCKGAGCPRVPSSRHAPGHANALT